MTDTTQTNSNGTDKLKESGTYVIGGATAGALLSALGGRAVLAFGSGVVGTGLAPTIIVGAAAGLAVYGGKEGFGPSAKKLWGKGQEWWTSRKEVNPVSTTA